MVLSFDRWVGKVAVVTGASAGIGESITENLVKKGIIVVGLARRSEKIESLSKKLTNEKGKLHALKCDVSNEAEVVKAFEWITANLGPVHILINNAGIVQQTHLINGDAAKWKKIFDINVIGLCIATREAVNIMQKNRIDGHIVHINSVAGHMVPDFPGMNVYPASKWAVTALTETLRLELARAGNKIKTTSVSPGYTRTEIFDVNFTNMTPEYKAAMDSVPGISSEDISDAVLYALSTPPNVQVQELTVAPITGDLAVLMAEHHNNEAKH